MGERKGIRTESALRWPEVEYSPLRLYIHLVKVNCKHNGQEVCRRQAPPRA